MATRAPQDHRFHVHIKDFIIGRDNLVFRNVDDFAECVTKAGIGYKHVELAEGLYCLRDGAAIVLQFCHIAENAGDAIAIGTGEFVEAILDNVDDTDPGPLFNVAIDNSPPNACAPAGHERDFAF